MSGARRAKIVVLCTTMFFLVVLSAMGTPSAVARYLVTAGQLFSLPADRSTTLLAAAPPEWQEYTPLDLTGRELFGLDMLSASDGWAVGGNEIEGTPTILHYQNGSWEDGDPIPGGLPMTVLRAVCFISPTLGWAAGDGGTILKYSHGAWQADNISGTIIADLNALHMLSADEGWAAGSGGNFYHYDGMSWSHFSDVHGIDAAINGLSFIDGGTGWAAGGLGTVSLFDGFAWLPVPSPMSKTVNAVDMVFTSAGWAVGAGGATLRFNGGAWISQTNPLLSLLTPPELLSVDALSTTDIWTVGGPLPGASQPAVMHWDAGSGRWFTDTVALAGSYLVTPLLQSVSMISPNEGWAAGHGLGVSETGPAPRGTILHYVHIPPPTPTSTQTGTPTRTATASSTPTATASPTATETATASPTASGTPTATATASATETATASPTASGTPTATATATASETATASPTTTQTPSGTATASATVTPTQPASPSSTPTPTQPPSPPSATPTTTTTQTASPSSTPTLTATPTTTETATATATATATPYEQAVRAGGAAYTDAQGLVWAADKAFTNGSWGNVGGLITSTAATISGTADQPLYRKDRYWTASAQPGYRFTVPSGRYEITFKFAETLKTAAGQRVFNVKIEGLRVLASYDIFARAGGRNIAHDEVVFADVNDGELTIDFVKITDNPKVNALRVRRIGDMPPATSTATATQTATATGTATATATPTPYVRRVNAGSSRYVDMAGNGWNADKAYTPGTWGYLGTATGTFTTTMPISGTSDAALYQTERNNMSGYAFTVPNGTYSLTLKFAENTYNKVSKRTFDVAIEGSTVLADFDIWSAAGGRYAAVDRTYVVQVTDGVLNIIFTPKIALPKISAIEVVQQ